MKSWHKNESENVIQCWIDTNIVWLHAQRISANEGICACVWGNDNESFPVNKVNFAQILKVGDGEEIEIAPFNELQLKLRY